MRKIRYLISTFLLCLALSVPAKVTLPAFFTDNMIIQQKTVLTIPGKTGPGKKVTIKASWDKTTYNAQADASGLFRIEIPTPEAGGPYTLTVSDGKSLTLSNIMSGEVWFCSGQSNMEMPLAGWGKVLNYEKEVAEARYPSIRLLQVKKKIAYTPQDDIETNMGGWQECSPGTVPEFSSVAYFYARELWKELNIPIGVIDCTWGGTPAEAWTSIGSIEQVMGFGEEAPPVSPESSGYPTVLYNGMVHALTQFPIKGVIWYQGEANVGRSEQYKHLFPTMILDWRKQWGFDFPFYFVQLANFLERVEVQPDSQWAALREAQSKALHLENTGMAVAIDIGEAHDVHPKNKQEVARRLAAQAFSQTYNKNIAANGPLYQNYRIVNNELIVRFDKNIQANGNPRGFILAGPDGVFHSAIAVVRGNEVVLRSSAVEFPLAARYGWADNPECTLYGENGLPVAPFRTEQ